MTIKKNGSAPVILFGVLCFAWAVEFFFFSESLSRAEDERDRLVAREKETSEECARLKRKAGELQEYKRRMTGEPEFVQQSAREILGAAQSGEIIIRAEGD